MRLLLVDGTNVVVRYAYAMLGERQEDPSDAEAASVVRGAERAIRHCATWVRCRHAAIALDSSAETWRRGISPGYKANRLGVTRPWSERLRAALEAGGWRCLQVDSFEADDIIATLAARGSERGHQPVVLSSDSDLLQLAGEFAEVWQFGRREDEPRFVQRTPEWVEAKYGLAAVGQLELYKALVGEPGENLPGVRGIGPKKAAALLRGCRTAQELLACQVLGIEAKAQLATMLALTSLRYDVPLPMLQPAECEVPRGTWRP